MTTTLGNRRYWHGVAAASVLIGAGSLIAPAVVSAAPANTARPAHAAPATASVASLKGTKLIGTFKITAGKSHGKTATGSYFRMILPGGNAKGPFFDNGSSKAANKSYTLLKAGTNGGIETGKYQPEPSPAFDSHGNSLAKGIIAPVQFTGIRFSASTQRKDPQLSQTTSIPEITVSHGKLHGNLSAFAASWNRQQFNQGSPKPNGTKPGETTSVTGTYNAKTGKFSLTWTSTIVGGPFDKFTGLWHFTGTFHRR